jgi:hypothetical protein
MQEILKQELNKELKKFETTFDGRIDIAVQELKTQADLLVINGIEDTEGYNKVKELHILVKNKCSEIEKTKKALNEDALAWQRSVNSEYKRIMGMLEPIKDDLDAKRKEIDNQKELEKTRIEREEQERQQKRIDRLYELGYTYDGMSYNLGDSMLHPVTISSYSDENFEVLVQKGIEMKAELEKKKQLEQEEALKKAQEEEKAKQERVAFLKERYEMRLFKTRDLEFGDSDGYWISFSADEIQAHLYSFQGKILKMMTVHQGQDVLMNKMFCKKYGQLLILCSQSTFVHSSSEEFDELVLEMRNKINEHKALLDKQLVDLEEKKRKEQIEQLDEATDKDKYEVFKQDLILRVKNSNVLSYTTKTYANKQSKLIQDILNLIG